MENKRVPIYPVFVDHQDFRRAPPQHRVQIAPESNRYQHPQQQYQQPHDYEFNPYANLQQNANNFAYGPHPTLPHFHPQAGYYGQPAYGAYMPVPHNLEPQLKTRYAAHENQRALMSDPFSDVSDHPASAPRFSAAKKLLNNLKVLDEEAKKYACLSHLHKLSMGITITLMLLGSIYFLISVVLSPNCSSRRDSDDICALFGAWDPEMTLIIEGILLVGGFITVVVDYHAIDAYARRSYSKMNCFYYFYLIFFIMSVIQLNLIGIVVYGYLYYAATKLVPIFKLVKETTKELFDMGVEQSTIDHTINPQDQ